MATHEEITKGQVQMLDLATLSLLENMCQHKKDSVKQWSRVALKFANWS
jgi:hypothetical protein